MIRTCEAEAADLQSAGFDRSPIPPRNLAEKVRFELTDGFPPTVYYK